MPERSLTWPLRSWNERSMPETGPRTDIAVKCRECGVEYSQRENLLSGEWLWFANCQCEKSADNAEVIEIDPDRELPLSLVATFWNGERTPARKVRVRVGTVPVKTWWCAGMEGTVRDAVEITYHDTKFYLDDEDGIGWEKVTTGHGGPRSYSRSLPDDSEVVS